MLFGGVVVGNLDGVAAVEIRSSGGGDCGNVREGLHEFGDVMVIYLLQQDVGLWLLNRLTQRGRPDGVGCAAEMDIVTIAGNSMLYARYDCNGQEGLVEDLTGDRIHEGGAGSNYAGVGKAQGFEDGCAVDGGAAAGGK